MEINDILNGFNGSDCDDKGCNNNHHHNNNCKNNCNNNSTWLILLLLLAGGNGFNGGCGQQMNHGCCNSCCCCEKPKFKKMKQTVYYPEYNMMPRDPGYNNNNIIWLILLLGLCGNNGFGFGSGNSCKC